MQNKNPIVQDVEKVIQALLYDLGVKMVMTYLIAQVPFLGYPLIRQIVTWVVTYVAGILYKYLDQFVVFSIIDFQTQSQAQDYLASVNKLQSAITSGDANAIEKAKSDFKTKLNTLVKFDL